MKIFNLIIIITLIISCEDNVTEPQTTIVDRPTICPQIPDGNLPTPYQFDGLKNVSEITTSTALLSWESSEDFIHYNLFQIQKFGREYIQTAPSPANQIQLTGLTPNTEYSYHLRAMDKNGRIDSNDKVITFKTLPWPNFINQKSLSLDGAQSLSLDSSKLSFDFHKDFAISIWAKTQIDFTSDNRILTLHQDLNAGSSISLSFKENKVILFYRNQAGNLKSIGKEFNYHDNIWHQYILTVKNDLLTLYIDGTKFFNKKVNIQTNHKHPFVIGAYTGIQKGFIGKLDELAFFNSSLDEAQVKELFNYGQSLDLKTLSFNLSGKHWFQFGDHNADNGNEIQDNLGNLALKGLNLSSTSINLDSP